MKEDDKYTLGKYWEERLSKDFSLAGVGSLGLGLEYNIWLYRARLQVLRELLKEKKIDCQGKRLLDIGIGTGFYINFWEKLGIKDTTGIDMTTKSIEELKKKYRNYKFIKADISDKNLPLKGKFDIITAFDVLFHIVKEEDFKQAIKNIKELSHKDTVILIMDNFLKMYKPARGHENDRTLDRYKKVFQDYNIKIVSIKPIFYFMNTPIDIERINSKSAHFLIEKIWKINNKIRYYSRRLKIEKVINYLLGLTLYTLDRIILRCVYEGPSTKLLLAKIKRD